MLIDTIFKVYDIENKGYIKKTDFIRLLYNYPDGNIFELIREVDNKDKKKELNQTSGTDKKKEQSYQRKSERHVEFEASLISKDDIMNYSQMVDNRAKSQYDLKKEGRTLGLTAQPFYNTPTTVNNKIKWTADIIFERYGKNGVFMFEDFNQWMKMHKNFLNNFKNWFKPDIWMSYRDEQTNQELLGFYKKKPLLEGPVKLQKFKGMTKKKSYARLYGNILMFFKSKQELLPHRTIILKLLEIGFNDKKQKILIEHPCKRYNDVKVIIKDKQVYERWKQLFHEFTNNRLSRRFNMTAAEMIGKGKFSTVFKITEIKTEKPYALKLITKKILTEEEREIMSNETKLLSILSHNNIIKLFQSIESHNEHFYLFEYINGMDLFRFISDRRFLNEYEASWVMKNLFDVIEYIHTSGILHRDLKPENIMIEVNKKGEMKRLKLLDFGLACYGDDEKAMKMRVGTLNYTAPEILSEQPYDHRVDLFSLGVIMYYMIRGTLPFYAEDPYMIAVKTINGEYDMEKDEFFDNVSGLCKDLLTRLLEADPEKRITIEEALCHDWIQKGETLKKYDNINKVDFNINDFL